MRVLIVEDERLLAESLKMLLERKGFTVETAYDGISGAEYAETGIYDLLILDVMRLLMQAGENNTPKETILTYVWGFDSDAVENNVEVYIGFLRKSSRALVPMCALNRCAVWGTTWRSAHDTETARQAGSHHHGVCHGDSSLCHGGGAGVDTRHTGARKP